MAKCSFEGCDRRAIFNYIKILLGMFRCKEHILEDMVDVVHPKCLFKGCSRFRPDCYIDKDTHILIIEIDENQHKQKYYTTCEERRNNELYEDFACRPLVFIRFNPDGYKLGNTKVPSSFKFTKTTQTDTIRNKKEWDNRLNTLKEKIEEYLVKIPENSLTQEYLFYDEI